MHILVLGLGNELFGDDGVGVHAVRRLQRETLPGRVTILEVGTAILDALPEMEQADRIIVLDAMKSEEPPGSIYKADLAECSGTPAIASMHGFDIHRVMALA
ncbi:MAG: hydrogenase maturation protease, partial [Desulfofustis sp.]|nr:hydrogenase maturation protease [Desulfofustis sp.]